MYLIAQSQRDSRAALKDAESGLKLDSNHGHSLWSKAQALRLLGRACEALPILDRVREIAPKNITKENLQKEISLCQESIVEDLMN